MLYHQEKIFARHFIRVERYQESSFVLQTFGCIYMLFISYRFHLD